MTASVMGSSKPRFLVVGRTGAGKSFFCRALGANVVSRPSVVRVTEDWSEHVIKLPPYGEICLVDTPGMYDRDEEVTKHNLEQVTSAMRSKEGVATILYMFNGGYSGRFEGDDAEGLVAVLNALGESNTTKLAVIVNVHAVQKLTQEEIVSQLYVELGAMDVRLGQVRGYAYSESDGSGDTERKMMLEILEWCGTNVLMEGTVERLDDVERRALKERLREVEREVERQKREYEDQVKRQTEKSEQIVRAHEVQMQQAREQGEALAARERQEERSTMENKVVERLGQINREIDELVRSRKKCNGSAWAGAILAPFTVGVTLVMTGGGMVASGVINKEIVKLIGEAQGLAQQAKGSEAQRLFQTIMSKRPDTLFVN